MAPERSGWPAGRHGLGSGRDAWRRNGRGPGALPGNYGTMLPAGHDGYLVFETTKYGVKFRVFAYVDFAYA